MQATARIDLCGRRKRWCMTITGRILVLIALIAVGSGSRLDAQAYKPEPNDGPSIPPLQLPPSAKPYGNLQVVLKQTQRQYRGQPLHLRLEVRNVGSVGVLLPQYFNKYSGFEIEVFYRGYLVHYLGFRVRDMPPYQAVVPEPEYVWLPAGYSYSALDIAQSTPVLLRAGRTYRVQAMFDNRTSFREGSKVGWRGTVFSNSVMVKMR